MGFRCVFKPLTRPFVEEHIPFHELRPGEIVDVHTVAGMYKALWYALDRAAVSVRAKPAALSVKLYHEGRGKSCITTQSFQSKCQVNFSEFLSKKALQIDVFMYDF